MPQYMLSVMQPVGEPPPPEVLGPIIENVKAVNDEMRAAGAWVFTAHLHPAHTATVLRSSGEDVLVTDGPYLEAKEHVGGFNVIEAPDLDAALRWAEQATVACLAPVEVRPFQEEPEEGQG